MFAKPQIVRGTISPSPPINTPTAPLLTRGTARPSRRASLSVYLCLHPTKDSSPLGYLSTLTFISSQTSVLEKIQTKQARRAQRKKIPKYVFSKFLLFYQFFSSSDRHLDSGNRGQSQVLVLFYLFFLPVSYKSRSSLQQKQRGAPFGNTFSATNYHLITQILPLMTQFPSNFRIAPPPPPN